MKTSIVSVIILGMAHPSFLFSNLVSNIFHKTCTVDNTNNFRMLVNYWNKAILGFTNKLKSFFRCFFKMKRFYIRIHYIFQG